MKKFFCGFVIFPITLLSTLIIKIPVNAGYYDAICNGTKCNLIIDAESIKSPYGTIPLNRVTSWQGGGDGETAVGVGIATSVVFGPLGLLGFLSKKYDYNFIINGYDDKGKRTYIVVQFINEKPAKRLMNELPLVTGLGLGQKRTAKEIRESESVDKNQESNPKNLFEGEDKIN